MKHRLEKIANWATESSHEEPPVDLQCLGWIVATLLPLGMFLVLDHAFWIFSPFLTMTYLLFTQQGSE